MNMFDVNQTNAASSENDITNGNMEGTSEFPAGSFLLPVRNESLDLTNQGRDANVRRSSRELRAVIDQHS